MFEFGDGMMKNARVIYRLSFLSLFFVLTGCASKHGNFIFSQNSNWLNFSGSDVDNTYTCALFSGGHRDSFMDSVLKGATTSNQLVIQENNVIASNGSSVSVNNLGNVVAEYKSGDNSVAICKTIKNNNSKEVHFFTGQLNITRPEAKISFSGEDFVVAPFQVAPNGVGKEIIFTGLLGEKMYNMLGSGVGSFTIKIDRINYEFFM